MDEVTYNNILSRNKKKGQVSILETNVSDRSLLTSLDIKDPMFADHVKVAFINELKIILKYNKLSEIVDAIFHFQSKLEELSKKTDSEEIPTLAPLYTHLAPMLMRIISDYYSTKQIARTSLEGPALESIRVAIEEEIYLQDGKRDEISSHSLDS